MQSDNEQLQSDFHQKADAIYFALMSAFEAEVKGINRRNNEFLFQQQKDTYCKTLKMELENCAALLMRQHPKNSKKDELDQNLQQFIKHYLHVFLQKTRSF
ncbi:MAG: hypothetical protein ACJ749_06945 [Flavisolibacter sp.]